MMLTLDADGTIWYRGNPVGKHSHKPGLDTVEIRLRYETTEVGQWVVPLSWLALGLQKLEPPPAPAVFEFRTPDDQLQMFGNVLRFLVERDLNAGGRTWRFHKTDVDPWPSNFHGHALDESLKLDAIDGSIYEIVTRQKVGRLKKKEVDRLHRELRNVSDLKHLFQYLPPVQPSRKTRASPKKSASRPPEKKPEDG